MRELFLLCFYSSLNKKNYQLMKLKCFKMLSSYSWLYFNIYAEKFFYYALEINLWRIFYPSSFSGRIFILLSLMNKECKHISASPDVFKRNMIKEFRFYSINSKCKWYDQFLIQKIFINKGSKKKFLELEIGKTFNLPLDEYFLKRISIENLIKLHQKSGKKTLFPRKRVSFLSVAVFQTLIILVSDMIKTSLANLKNLPNFIIASENTSNAIYFLNILVGKSPLVSVNFSKELIVKNSISKAFDSPDYELDTPKKQINNRIKTFDPIYIIWYINWMNIDPESAVNNFITVENLFQGVLLFTQIFPLKIIFKMVAVKLAQNFRTKWISYVKNNIRCKYNMKMKFLMRHSQCNLVFNFNKSKLLNMTFFSY